MTECPVRCPNVTVQHPAGDERIPVETAIHWVAAELDDILQQHLDGQTFTYAAGQLRLLSQTLHTIMATINTGDDQP